MMGEFKLNWIDADDAGINCACGRELLVDIDITVCDCGRRYTLRSAHVEEVVSEANKEVKDGEG